MPSYTRNLLETETLTAEKEDNIKWSAASMYSGGADTVGAISSYDCNNGNTNANPNFDCNRPSPQYIRFS